MSLLRTIKEKREFVFPIAYLFVIAVGMIFAFPMERDNSDSFFFLIALTLPWSIVSFFVMMMAIHDGIKNEVGLVVFTFTAMLNALILYWISKKPVKVEEISTR